MKGKDLLGSEPYNLGRLDGAMDVMEELGIGWSAHNSQLRKAAMADIEARKSGKIFLRDGVAAFYLTDQYMITLTREEDFYSLEARRLVPEWRTLVEEVAGQDEGGGRWFIAQGDEMLTRSKLGRDSAYAALHGEVFLLLPEEDDAFEADEVSLQLLRVQYPDDDDVPDEGAELEVQVRALFSVAFDGSLLLLSSEDGEEIMVADLVEEGFAGWEPYEPSFLDD